MFSITVPFLPNHSNSFEVFTNYALNGPQGRFSGFFFALNASGSGDIDPRLVSVSLVVHRNRRGAITDRMVVRLIGFDRYVLVRRSNCSVASGVTANRDSPLYCRVAFRRDQEGTLPAN